jgi:hypothetical protein
MTNQNPHQISRLNIALKPAVRHQLDQLASERGLPVTGLVNEFLERVIAAEMQPSSKDSNEAVTAF